MEKKKVMLVFGTRPEAIKMAPVVGALKAAGSEFEVIVTVTGQHRQMLDSVLAVFDIKPDYDLNIMRPGQDLYDVTSRVLSGMREVFSEVRPDIVLVHGDTSTSTAAALAAFYARVKVGHVEAGLRTGDIYSPWPEEMNRRLTGRLANVHFSPTETAKGNLLRENVANSDIFITGNTVIDALMQVKGQIEGSAELDAALKETLRGQGYDVGRLSGGRRLVLVTGHRRENFGEGFRNICLALAELSAKYGDAVDFVYPMHLNPNVRGPIAETFGGRRLDNMFFIEPVDYLPFVYLMMSSHVILTDSGGIQEEAPSLGKPVMVMRDTTERPEALEAGTVELVGTDMRKIVDGVSRLLDDDALYRERSSRSNPYGDGMSSQRIVEALRSVI
jgi:UDP-N-acetylglucosamine 2-epimerase (non-hydrolysing)